MKYKCLLSYLTVAIFLLGGSAALAALRDKIETELQNIKSQTGVQVHYLYDPATFFPKEWQDDDTSPRAEQLPLDEVWHMIPLIKRFLAVYPENVLRADLTGIYLASRLSFFDKNYGGTSHVSSIYINCDEETPDAFLLARMHSEFSSILLRKHPFSKEQWAKLNPPQFRYVGSGVPMLGQRNLYAQDHRLLSDGFLVRYSQSSLENDFNMITDWLFTKRNNLNSLCKKYPAIREKRDLAINFYQSVGCQLSGS